MTTPCRRSLSRMANWESLRLRWRVFDSNFRWRSSSPRSLFWLDCCSSCVEQMLVKRIFSREEEKNTHRPVVQVSEFWLAHFLIHLLRDVIDHEFVEVLHHVIVFLHRMFRVLVVTYPIHRGDFVSQYRIFLPMKKKRFFFCIKTILRFLRRNWSKATVSPYFSLDNWSDCDVASTKLRCKLERSRSAR